MLILLPLLRRLGIRSRLIVGLAVTVAGALLMVAAVTVVAGLLIHGLVTVMVGAVFLIGARSGLRRPRARRF